MESTLLAAFPVGAEGDQGWLPEDGKGRTNNGAWAGADGGDDVGGVC